jgi:penicillin-binding protein 1C
MLSRPCALARLLRDRAVPGASFEQVRASWRSADAWLLDRNGEALSRMRVDRSRRRGDWVELAQSPARWWRR